MESFKLSFKDGKKFHIHSTTLLFYGHVDMRWSGVNNIVVEDRVLYSYIIFSFKQLCDNPLIHSDMSGVK